MKYKTLLKILQELPKERLEDDVIILDPVNDEFFPVKSTGFANEWQEILDVGHLYIRMVE